MEDKNAISVVNDEEDYTADNDQDNGEDYEATIDEEELLEGGDYADELNDLKDEGEMSIEELRKMYGYPPEGQMPPANDVDYADYEDDEDEEDEDTLEADDSSKDGPPAEHRTILDMGNSMSGFEEEDDGDYAPPDPWRRSIRVDPIKFQAEIPDVMLEEERAKNTADPNNDAILLWSRSDTENADDEKLNKFLSDVVDMRVAHEQHHPPQANKTRDDEDALCALQRNGFDVEKTKNSFPFPHINAPFRTVRQDALGFDEAEIKTFEESLELYGKDFPLIQRMKLPYRKVGELVEYYYQWKLTPSYREWRAAHPYHVAVVQPHMASLFYEDSQNADDIVATNQIEAAEIAGTSLITTEEQHQETQ